MKPTWSPVPARCKQMGFTLYEFHPRGKITWKYAVLVFSGIIPDRYKSKGEVKEPSITWQSDHCSSCRKEIRKRGNVSRRSTRISTLSVYVTYLCYVYWIITRYEIVTGLSISYDLPKLEYPEIRRLGRIVISLCVALAFDPMKLSLDHGLHSRTLRNACERTLINVVAPNDERGFEGSLTFSNSEGYPIPL